MDSRINIEKKPFSRIEFFDGTLTIYEKKVLKAYPFYLKVATDLENQMMSVRKVTWKEDKPSKHEKWEDEIKKWFYLTYNL